MKPLAARQWRRGLFALALFGSHVEAAAPAGDSQCLFATTVGDDEIPVGRCTNVDPLSLARNEQVKRLLAAIPIAPGLVTFRGCSGDVYAVRHAPGAGYVVTYPPDDNKTFLAPIAHELSHVVQIEAAGGLDQLTEQYKSRQIELGADYLAGVLFRQVLPEVSRNEFQHHVRLNGLYRERRDRAHGTPAQRTSAFRMGVVGYGEKAHLELTQSLKKFADDLYALVIAEE